MTQMANLSAKVADAPPNASGLDAYVDPITSEEENLVKVLPSTKSLVDGLRDMEQNEELVSTLPGDSCWWCCSTTVLEGQLGCATKYGQTHFLPPGSYVYKGWGVHLEESVDVEKTSESGSQFSFKDVTYLNLAENNMAVIQVAHKSIVLGSGRYLLRDPARCMGKIDVQNLLNPLMVTAITEGQDAHGKEIQDVTRIEAGRSEKRHCITFVRANPGFNWVVQTSKGGLVAGVGFQVCRFGENFLTFVDMQHYGRTTRKFQLLSKDRHEVAVRVQLRWRIEDAIKWIECKGASEDIFDAIEETAQALLRDAIAGQSYEECRRQASEGYEGIESSVVDRLRDETEKLGGRLLGFEIRMLTFPLLAARNLQRAQKENRDNEALYEAKNKLAIEDEDRKRKEVLQQWEMKMEQIKIKHRADMQALKDKLNLQKMQEQAAYDRAKQQYEEERKELNLKGIEAHQRIEIEKKEAAAVAEARRRMITKKGEADVKLQQARAESESIKVKANADAYSREQLAEAEAKAAELVGAAYKSNPAFLHLEMEKINTSVMSTRASALSDALTANPSSLMPVDLQRELAFLRTNMSPVRPIILPGGGGVVQMRDVKGIQHGL